MRGRGRGRTAAGAEQLRKVLHDPKDVYERPNEDATCTVVYTVTLVGGASLGESKSTFAAGDRAVLPALDDAVREMKAGERCLVTAPAAVSTRRSKPL